MTADGIRPGIFKATRKVFDHGRLTGIPDRTLFSTHREPPAGKKQD
jgi:hypothetical protein